MFNDFHRFSTILGRPAVSGSIAKTSPDFGRLDDEKVLKNARKKNGVLPTVCILEDLQNLPVPAN